MALNTSQCYQLLAQMFKILGSKDLSYSTMLTVSLLGLFTAFNPSSFLVICYFLTSATLLPSHSQTAQLMLPWLSSIQVPGYSPRLAH